MSVSEKGKVLPIMGKVFPGMPYPVAIAIALQHDLGGTRRAIKTVAKWTGASERTIKHWFAGTSGPSGEHLVALIRQSGAVLEAFLVLARRDAPLVSHALVDIEGQLTEALVSLREILRAPT